MDRLPSLQLELLLTLTLRRWMAGTECAALSGLLVGEPRSRSLMRACLRCAAQRGGEAVRQLMRLLRWRLLNSLRVLMGSSIR